MDIQGKFSPRVLLEVSSFGVSVVHILGEQFKNLKYNST